MKKILILILTTACFLSIASAKHFWRGKTMTTTQAEKLWGSKPFDSKEFKDGDQGTRAQMAASLIRGKTYIGKKVEDVRSELGSWDGYYFRDSFPAYIISEGKLKNDPVWQIVFSFDQSKKIDEVFIHRNN